MKRRIALLTIVVGLIGVGVASAANSGLSRTMLAKGTAEGVSVDAEGPVEVSHLVVTWEPKGTTGWVRWQGPLLVTVKTGEISYQNAAENDCAQRTVKAGISHVIPAGSVHQATNNGSQPAEVHMVAFLPPGSGPQPETQPAGCRG